MRAVLLILVACASPLPVEERTVWSELGEVDHDGDGFAAALDCDDERPDVFPGATEEVADGVDQDCDGHELCYADDDHDGFGGVEVVAVVGEDCDVPRNFTSSVSTDCNDFEAWVNPAADEHPADGVDQDCDGLEHCFIDADRDGWGASQHTPHADLDCLSSGVSYRVGDCDDGDGSRHPSRVEACNGVDDDCDAIVDGPTSHDAVRLFQDQDGDGWGVRTEVTRACPPLEGWARIAGDCNDLFSGAFPGNQEICDGVDNDCDVGVDEASDALGVKSWFLDGDGDGLGDPDTERVACNPPDRLWVDNALDCNDDDAFKTCRGCDHGGGGRSLWWLALGWMLRRSRQG